MSLKKSIKVNKKYSLISTNQVELVTKTRLFLFLSVKWSTDDGFKTVTEQKYYVRRALFVIFLKLL